MVSLIDGKANARETVAVEQFARALEVDAPEVRDLRYLFNGEMLRLRLDLARRFWLREKVKESGRRNVSEASASSCAAPITGARTGFFDPAKAMIAIRRGATMNVDLNNGWNYWPVMGEQVEELRRRYNILAIEAFLPTKPPHQLAGSAA